MAISINSIEEKKRPRQNKTSQKPGLPHVSWYNIPKREKYTK
jgi:hypothetical protein